MLSVEYRAQKLGRSSLVVTLPRIWVRSLRVRSGDRLKVEILSNGSLRIEALKEGVKPGATEAPGQPPTTSDAPVVPTKEES